MLVNAFRMITMISILLFQDSFLAVDDVNSLFWGRNALSLEIEDYFLSLNVASNLADAVGYAWYSCSRNLLGCQIEGEGNIVGSGFCDNNGGITFRIIIVTIVFCPSMVCTDFILINAMSGVRLVLVRMYVTLSSCLIMSFSVAVSFQSIPSISSEPATVHVFSPITASPVFVVLH